MKLIIVNGKPCSGKTTFEQICKKKLGSDALIVSTIDFVKEIAKTAGWDGTKTPKNREFLSDLKDLLTRWNDGPFNAVIQRIDYYRFDLQSYGLSDKFLLVFVDAREPKEIQKFVDRLNAITVLIKRKEVDSLPQSNHADAEVDDYTYDFVIENNGTLEELEAKAEKFIAKITDIIKFESSL